MIHACKITFTTPEGKMPLTRTSAQTEMKMNLQKVSCLDVPSIHLAQNII
jgi:hypothetical protein